MNKNWRCILPLVTPVRWTVGYVYGVASQKRYIGQVHRFGAPFRCTVHCTEFGALVHRIQCTSAPSLVHYFWVSRMLVISCFVFNLWTMLFNHSSDQLPKDVILRIFSFISFHLIRRTISLLCRKWNRISEDPSIVRKVPIENFESIRLHESLTFTQLKNVVESYLGSHSRHQTKTNTFCSQTSLYRIGFKVGLPLGFHCPNTSNSSEKYLWIHV